MTVTEQIGNYLQYVYITDIAGKPVIAINAEDKWSSQLPKKFDAAAAEKVVYELCEQHGIDYIAEDTVRNAVKEGIKTYYLGKTPPKTENIKFGKDEKEERTVSEIGDPLIETYNFKTPRDSLETFYYDREAGIYKRGGGQAIEESVRQQNPNISKHDLSEIIYYVQTMTYIDRAEFDNDPHWLHVGNRWVNPTTNEFKSHSPELLSLFKIPWDYDKDAKNPEQIQFFSDIFEEEDLPVVQKFFGYLLLPDQRYKKAFLGIGPKDTGKSKFAELVETFAGMVSHVTLHDMDRRNHNLASITKSIVNTASEISKYKLKDVSIFKAITGGDEIQFREIYGRPFDTRVRAKILVVGNDKPNFDDMDKTFIERWIVFKFTNVFKSGEDMDPKIMDRLTTPEEMSGLLNYAIEGLGTLQKVGYFKKQVWEDVKADWDRLDNKIASYKDNHCILQPNVSILAEELYSDYKTKGGELSVRIFGREIKKLGGVAHKQTRVHGRQRWTYEGITTKERFDKGLVTVVTMNLGTLGTVFDNSTISTIGEGNTEFTVTTVTAEGPAS